MQQGLRLVVYRERRTICAKARRPRVARLEIAYIQEAKVGVRKRKALGQGRYAALLGCCYWLLVDGLRFDEASSLAVMLMRGYAGGSKSSAPVPGRCPG